MEIYWAKIQPMLKPCLRESQTQLEVGSWELLPASLSPSLPDFLPAGPHPCLLPEAGPLSCPLPEAGPSPCPHPEAGPPHCPHPPAGPAPYRRYWVRSISSHSSHPSRAHRQRNGPPPLSGAWSPVPWPPSSGPPPPWLPPPGAPFVRSGMQPGPSQRLHLGSAGAGPAPGPPSCQ